MAAETIPTGTRNQRTDVIMACVVLVLGLVFPFIGFVSGMLTSWFDMTAFTLGAVWIGTLDRIGAAVFWIWERRPDSLRLSVYPLCSLQAVASVSVLFVAPIGVIAFVYQLVLIGLTAFLVTMLSFMCIIFVESVNDAMQGQLPVTK